MRITATEDVRTVDIEMLVGDLRGVIAVDVDENRMAFRSAEPPSWIALIQHIPTWAAIIGPSAAVFLNELLKEAGKDAYKNKTKVARVLAKPLVKPLQVLAAAIVKFQEAGRRTNVDVGAPVPDEYFGTRLRLTGDDQESIALELALFVRHCGGIQTVLDGIHNRDSRVIGQVTLTLFPDGSMHIQWMESDAGIRTETLPRPRPDERCS